MNLFSYQAMRKSMVHSLVLDSMEHSDLWELQLVSLFMFLFFDTSHFWASIMFWNITF